MDNRILLYKDYAKDEDYYAGDILVDKWGYRHTLVGVDVSYSSLDKEATVTFSTCRGGTQKDYPKGMFIYHTTSAPSLEEGVTNWMDTKWDDTYIPYYRGKSKTTNLLEDDTMIGNELDKKTSDELLASVLETCDRSIAHIYTPKIKEIYVNKKKKTLVIKWANDEQTKVTCHKGDKFDLEKGMAMAITKFVLGNNYNYYNMLDKYMKSVKYTESKPTKKNK